MLTGRSNRPISAFKLLAFTVLSLFVVSFHSFGVTNSVSVELTLEKIRDVLQLRNVILSKATVLHHKRKDVVVLLAGVRWK